MGTKKHTLFTWNRVLFGDWIWMLFALGPPALFLKAVHYNYLEGRDGIPLGGWVTSIAAIAVTWGIIVLRFVLRHRFIKSIVFYTKQGTAVELANEAVRERIAAFDARVVQQHLEDEIERTLEFFVRWNKGRTLDGKVSSPVVTAEELGKPLNGAILTITDKPFRRLYTNRLNAPSLTDKVMGIQYLDRFVITWDGEKVRNLDDLCRLLSHEVGHFCLDQLGYLDKTGGDTHHKMFKEIGFER